MTERKASEGQKGKKEKKEKKDERMDIKAPRKLVERRKKERN